ncbi:MAG TPA: hypothetical protein PKU80_13140 [Candidatus Limiplasma sp.]|nr:hypothetical protein [Candidatus Limiplasma sp.]
MPGYNAGRGNVWGAAGGDGTEAGIGGDENNLTKIRISDTLI